MSGPEQAEATPNRKQRRARQSPSVSGLRLASLMQRTYDSGDLPRQEGEPDAHYFRRLRKSVLAVQKEQARAKRKAAHGARVTRQRAARAARRKKR